MIQWAYYPRSQKANDLVIKVVGAFNSNFNSIDSSKHNLNSNNVLDKIADDLEAGGFKVERGKKKEEKIAIPILYGRNGVIDKKFFADAYHELGKFVLEIEAGRGVVNNQFLKDLFQACVMPRVDYFSVAVRLNYRGNNNFEEVCKFFDAIYSSDKFKLPLMGCLIIGY